MAQKIVKANKYIETKYREKLQNNYDEVEVSRVKAKYDGIRLIAAI